jgi:uncharacterized membrane protein
MAKLPTATAYKHWHLVMIIVWTIMFPVALLTGLKDSLPFIVGISLYANWATEVGAWQASRAEVRVDEIDVNADTANVTAKEATVNIDDVT